MTRRICILLVILFGCCQAAIAGVHWRDILSQPADWYASPTASEIADAVLLYQRDSGGWPKNIDMAQPLSPAEKAKLRDQKNEKDSTIDNGATYTQLIFLARVHKATRTETYREAFLAGLDYLLKAQYANGGWPQYYPDLSGYFKHITFNDDAMIGVMKLLRDTGTNSSDFSFVDSARRSQAKLAVEKGIACILRTQVVVN